MRKFWSESVPANVILAYRVIPGSVRARWGFGKPGTSAEAYRAVRLGAGWSAFRRPGGITIVNLYCAALAIAGIKLAQADANDWWTGGPFWMVPGVTEWPDWFPTTGLKDGQGNWKLDT